MPPVTSKSRLKIVRDITSGKGPLFGIYTGLRALGYENGFTVACDMPFVQSALVKKMISVARGYDVVIPRGAEGLEPLHAVYARSCLGPIETLIASGRYKIDTLLTRVNVRYFGECEIKSLDPEGISFFNINTPSELVRAEELLGKIN